MERLISDPEALAARLRRDEEVCCDIGYRVCKLPITAVDANVLDAKDAGLKIVASYQSKGAKSC